MAKKNDSGEKVGLVHAANRATGRVTRDEPRASAAESDAEFIGNVIRLEASLMDSGVTYEVELENSGGEQLIAQTSESGFQSILATSIMLGQMVVLQHDESDPPQLKRVSLTIG